MHLAVLSRRDSSWVDMKWEVSSPSKMNLAVLSRRDSSWVDGKWEVNSPYKCTWLFCPGGTARG